MAKNFKMNIPWESESGIPLYRGISGTDQAYSTPLIYRAVRLRCNSLIRVPRYIFNESDDPVEYAFESQMPLERVIWNTEAALLLKGAAYLLKLKNRFRYGKGVQWLNPFTVQSEYRDGELRFWQQLPGGERFPKTGYWTVDDFVYFREFNPDDDLGAGVSAAEVALADASSSAAVSEFLANFFGSDAIPITMVVMPEGTSPEERQRVETWFKKKLRQLAGKAQRVLGIRGDVKLEKLTSNLRDYDFTSIDKHATDQIAHAFEIPRTILTAESANYATAQIERRIYLEDTIAPRCKMFEQVFNPFLAEVGQRLEFVPEELPEAQETESDRATNLKALVDSTVPLLAALDILGYDLSDEAEKLIKESEAEKEKRREEIANRPIVAEEEDEQNPEMKMDLDKWLRKAVKSMKAGKSPVVEFESSYIPNEMKSEILIGLKSATTEDDVRKSFNGHLEKA